MSPFPDREAQIGLLGGLVGAEIAELWLEQSQSGADDPEPELMSVWIVLRDGRGVRISAAPGGDGVLVSREPPAAADMGEWGQIDVAAAAGRNGLRPGRISQVWVIDSPHLAGADRLAGVRWRQFDGTDVAVFQDDDCLLIGPFEDVAKDPGVARYELSLNSVVEHS